MNTTTAVSLVVGLVPWVIFTTGLSRGTQFAAVILQAVGAVTYAVIRYRGRWH